MDTTVQQNIVETEVADANPVAAASAIEMTPVVLDKPIKFETPGLRLEVTSLDLLGQSLIPNGKKTKALSVVFFEIEGRSNVDRYLEGCGSHTQFNLWRQLLPGIFTAIGLDPRTETVLNGYPDRVNQRPGFVLVDDVNLQVFVNCKLTVDNSIMAAAAKASKTPKAPKTPKVQSDRKSAAADDMTAETATEDRKWPWEEEELKVGGDDLEQPVDEATAHMDAIAGEEDAGEASVVEADVEETTAAEDAVEDEIDDDENEMDDDEPSEDELDDIENEDDAE